MGINFMRIFEGGHTVPKSIQFFSSLDLIMMGGNALSNHLVVNFFTTK